MHLEDQLYIDTFYDYKKKLMKQHPLRILFIEVTSRCNARCEHCGSSCGDFIPKDEVTNEELKAVLDDIAKHYNPRDTMINITGGEPLVKKDLFELMDYANKLGFYWGMTTNGMLIDEEIVKKMADTGMYSVSVSLDGLKETHESFRKVPNCYEKILKGIDLMLHTPSIQIVQVTTVVNKKNIEQLEDMYELVKKLGVKNWRILNVDPIGRARDNKEILLDGKEMQRMIDFIHEKEELFNNKQSDVEVGYGCAHFLGAKNDTAIRKQPFICVTGVIIGSVLSNGDIFVCPDVPRVPELIQGNIRKDSFVEVWEKKFKQFRKITRTTNSKCNKCPDKKLCTGGAFHTWDYEEKKQLMCYRELLNDKVEKSKKVKNKKAKK